MGEEKFLPIRFIEEPVEVLFDTSHILEKKPHCPSAFRWRQQLFTISRLIMEWHDYQRRGRMERNLQPQHAAIAKSRGSWGVGKFYFRVEVEEHRIFDLYYDRSPKDVDNRKGIWLIYQELKSTQDDLI